MARRGPAVVVRRLRLFRGQVKGNWILPGFLGLWPLAFAAPRAPSRFPRLFPALLLAAGVLQAAVPAVSLHVPAVAQWLSRSPLLALDATYTGIVSVVDLPREPTFSWTERVCEYHGWPAFGAAVDSALTVAGVTTPVIAASAQYGLAFGLARYARVVESVAVLDDPRFARFAGDTRGVRLWARRAGSGVPGDAGARPVAVVHRRGHGCSAVAYELFLSRPRPDPRPSGR